MREILFRGKRIDNSEWVFGDLRHDYDHAPRCISDYCGANPVDPNTVGQYTGLTDTNGKKVFEGDIVTAQDDIIGSPFCDGITGKIIYDEAAFFIMPKDPMETQWLFDECAVYEVIGNIHDNPELLKGGAENER